MLICNVLPEHEAGSQPPPEGLCSTRLEIDYFRIFTGYFADQGVPGGWRVKEGFQLPAGF